jgi:hypothetical protein
MSSLKFAKSILLIIFFVSTINNLLASEQFAYTELPLQHVNDKDSLFLIHQKSKIVATIYPGDVLKLWIGDKREEGVFKAVENGMLILTSSGKDLSINLNEISKIRAMNSHRSQKNGTLLIVLGSGALLVATAILVAFSIASAGAIDAWIVTFAAVFGGPPALVGYLGLKFGLKKRGRNFIINEHRWQIQ